MYLRLSRQKRADGSILAHLQIAENVWDPEKKRSQARIVYNRGRADDAAVAERLKRLAHSILRRCSPEDIVASQSNWRLLDAWPYGDVYVLEKIWHRLGIDEVIAEVLGKRKFDFPVEQVKHDLKGWRLGRCVFVGDAGMVSKDNLKKLALGGGRYIVCMPVHAGGEVDREVVSRPGRYRPVAENLKVKEVVVGDGERRRRYVVCHNPSEAERKRRHRAVVLGELATELESLREDNEPGHSKRVCALRASARYGRYVRLTRTGQPRNDRAKIKAAERLDGKFVVHGNDDSLSAEDLALGYKQLQRVEEAWRRLKSGLKLRPVYHFAPQRIRAHVALSVLALLLERVAERACGDTWRNIRDDVKRKNLAQLSGPDGELWQVTDPGPDAAKLLKSLQIPHPPPILRLA